MISIRLTVDTRPFEAALADILALVEAPDRSVEARNALAHRILGCLEQGRGVRIDRLSTAAAGVVGFSLEITEPLLGDIAAFRAGD